MSPGPLPGVCASYLRYSTNSWWCLISSAYLCGPPRLCGLYVFAVPYRRVAEAAEVRRECWRTKTPLNSATALKVDSDRDHSSGPGLTRPQSPGYQPQPLAASSLEGGPEPCKR